MDQFFVNWVLLIIVAILQLADGWTTYRVFQLGGLVVPQSLVP